MTRQIYIRPIHCKTDATFLGLALCHARGREPLVIEQFGPNTNPATLEGRAAQLGCVTRHAPPAFIESTLIRRTREHLADLPDPDWTAIEASIGRIMEERDGSTICEIDGGCGA